MAEIVEYRQERMLPVYEQMKKKQIFSDEELRLLKKRREGHDYKISKKGKSIKDFIEYIEFEKNLLVLLAEREKTRQQKYKHIINGLGSHIKGLYNQVLGLFPEEYKLWEAYIKFCKYAKYAYEVAPAFERMLQYHSDKPGTYIRAAMWEYHEIKNMERVKDIFMRGLQRHPTNVELYLQFFRVMLADAANLKTELTLEDNTESEQTLGLKRLEIIFESSKKYLHSIELLDDILKATEEYPFTKSLQKSLIEDMLTNYKDVEDAWHILAQRELRGYHMSDFSGKKFEVDEEEEISTEDAKEPNGFLKRTLERRIELCTTIYEKAVKLCPTQKMWTFFINAMLEINLDMSTQPALKRKKLGSTLKAAHASNYMSEDHYYWYISLLSESKGNDKLIMDILEKAIKLHPQSVKIWEQWQDLNIQNDDEPNVYTTFRDALKQLDETNSVSLWRITLSYYKSNTDYSQRTKELFSEVCKKTNDCFGQFRGMYLDWVANTQSIDETRKVYHELNEYPPQSLELHQKMIELESQQETPKISQWRKCYELASHYFGKINFNIWIDYMQFEREHGDIKRVTLLYERAKEALSVELIEDFITKHSLLNLYE